MTYHQLTEQERYRITAQRMLGASQAEIARELGRHPSTISRELGRNRTRHDNMYRAENAHSYAVARRRRCRRRSHFSAQQMYRVKQLIERKWSPEQISGTLKDRGEMSISHETIYRRLRWDRRMGGQLYKHTRIMSKNGRKRYRSPATRGVMPGKRHISERPLHVEKRQHLGHWEGDTVMGSDMRHCLLTLVERKSGYVLIKKLKARTKEEVTRAAIRAIGRHEAKFKSITFDNGTEFHDFAALEQRFKLKCYFATPYHSWERGSNENMNGLIRQYLPKGMCMSRVMQKQCDGIADDLNSRPRKRFGFKTPAQIYYRY